MSIDPRTPVIVGVGQFKQQLDDVTQAVEQVELMANAVRLAAEDAATPSLLAAIDRLLVIGGLWRYPDPGRLVADAVGASEANTLLTAMGGNMPQACVSDAAERILAGASDVVVVCGGEAVYSKNKLRKLGQDFPRSGHDLAPAPFFGENVQMSSEHEQDRGFVMPTQIYPLFESALRAARGETFAQHRARVGKLWEGFNQVAVKNPYAWVRTPMTAQEIVTPSPTNRMVGSPYTKSMNANSFVDFGAAVIVCSAEKAEALGVPKERWVFPHAATDGHATLLFSERDTYVDSPAIRHTARTCLETAGVGIDDIAHMDLYSCFPSVVQITMAELGIQEDRQVTTTGGLPFFGGPMNSYVLHAIASTIEAVRSDPGSSGFVHANGGYATKHACAVYSTEPPQRAFRRVDAQDAIDAHPRREVDEVPAGEGTIETFTVMHDREGPERAFVTVIMPSGKRALGSTTDADTMAGMLETDHVGLQVTMAPTGDFMLRGD